jgi:tRNA dimethylallyltransferase
MKKVLVIVGPTAVGKSDFGVKCAKLFNGEIISGDSIQVYKGFDIGSGKVTEAEKDGIVHHMIDIKEPDDNYSVYQFQQLARSLIDDITNRGKLPIIVGGTGLYIKACLYDYFFDKQEEIDTSVFDEKTNQELFELLEEKDFETSTKIHINNRKRLIRALVIAENNSSTKSENLNKQKKEMLYDALIVGCTSEREKLYERINLRVDLMFENGLVDEVECLLKKVNFDSQSMQGIGYREFKGLYDKEYDLEKTKQLIKTHSRQFAKRQYTWFNNQMEVNWVDLSVDDNSILELIENWSKNGN